MVNTWFWAEYRMRDAATYSYAYIYIYIYDSDGAWQPFRSCQAPGALDKMMMIARFRARRATAKKRAFSRAPISFHNFNYL